MNTNHPEVSVHLLRLYHLRQVVWPLAEARDALGHLKFGIYRSECGAYACLLGEAAMTSQLQADGWWWPILEIPAFAKHRSGTSSAMAYYRLDSGNAERLFGCNLSHTLADRRRLLDEIIEHKEAVRD